MHILRLNIIIIYILCCSTISAQKRDVNLLYTTNDSFITKVKTIDILRKKSLFIFAYLKWSSWSSNETFSIISVDKNGCLNAYLLTSANELITQKISKDSLKRIIRAVYDANLFQMRLPSSWEQYCVDTTWIGGDGPQYEFLLLTKTKSKRISITSDYGYFKDCLKNREYERIQTLIKQLWS